MRKRVWNPYLAGAMAGVLLVLSVLIAGKFLGASTTFSRSASIIEKALGIDTTQFEYFTEKKGKYGPGSLPDWQLLFVIGIIIGSFISSKLSGEFKIQMVPDMWHKNFGYSSVKRGAVAFIGGVIALVGARLAGGWPSGHGLSGLAQLSVSGFIALVFFFIGGLITANLIYSGQRR